VNPFAGGESVQVGDVAAESATEVAAVFSATRSGRRVLIRIGVIQGCWVSCTYRDEIVACSANPVQASRPAA
jgi:hypothetical protein